MHGVKALAGREHEVVAAYVAGASLDQLSEQHDISVDALRKLLRAEGVRMRPSGAPWPYDRETERLIAEEYAAGFSPKKLASRYGGDERTIRKAVRKQGGTIRVAGAAPVDAVLTDVVPTERAGSGAPFRILVGASMIFAVLLVGAYMLSYWNTDRPALASTREPAAIAAPTTTTTAPAPTPTSTSTTTPPPTTTSTTVPRPPYVVTMTTCQQVGDDLTITGTLVNQTGGSESFRVQVLVVDSDGETLDESTVTSRTLTDGEKAAWTARATSSVDLRSGGGSCRLGVVETAGA